MTQHFQMIMGLSGSGKTTFLAALWYLITSGEVETDLRLDITGSDPSYLNEISKLWQAGIEVVHTSLQQEKKVEIHLVHPGTEKRVTVEFPDLSGESFNIQVEKRLCNPEYVKSLNSDCGILLMVTAKRTNNDRPLVDFAGIFSDEAPGQDASQNVHGKNKRREWTPRDIRVPVRLVDLLQFLLDNPFKKRCRRVAVVVSAWDLVRASYSGPEHWIEKNIPLFYQFIGNQSENFEIQFYGVSAQGGTFKKKEDKGEIDEERKQLLDRIASERIICDGPNCRPHDLTSPILWLMEPPEKGVKAR